MYIHPNHMSKLTDPRIPAGFMELLPQEQIVFNGLLDTIRRTYELYGFAPIETPAIEFAEVLLAKAGGETEKQLYRFTRGDNDLCLRFDLTVPLARYVAAHQHQLVFPFKRYQIQKVWRAERPQKGRLREFYQCDIDIVGSASTLADAEVVGVINAVFNNLGLNRFTVRISNRKILTGFLASLGLVDLAADILRLVDKMEKQDHASLSAEMGALGVDSAAVEKIFAFVALKGSPNSVIAELRSLGIDNELFATGVDELETTTRGIAQLGVPDENYQVDLTIARGLDYYTGTVYETVLHDYPGIGSVCSGGRYDNLTGFYTDAVLPGVGISIGLTRLFDQLRAAGLYNETKPTPAKVLVAQVGPDFTAESLKVASAFRAQGISTETSLEETSLGKQLKYANRLQVPFVAIIGMQEAGGGEIVLKNMETAEQSVVTVEEATTFIKKPGICK